MPAASRSMTAPAASAVFLLVLQGGCCSAEPELLASGQKLPRGVAVDSGFVYWTSTDSARSLGLVRKVPLRGGRITTLFRARRAAPAGIALDRDHVYWTDAGATGFDGRIMKVHKDGGEAVTIADGQSGPRSFAVLANRVYWTNRGAGESAGSIVRSRSDGEEQTVIAPARSNPWSLAVDRGRVFWTEATVRYAGKVVIEGRVMSADARGSTARVLARARGWPQEIAVDEERVYWTEQRGVPAHRSGAHAGGAVMSVRKGGGSPRALATLDQVPGPIALGADRVYWLQERLHDRRSPGFCYTLMSVDKRGGSPRVLASEKRGPGAIAVHDPDVYWTDIGVARPFSRPRFEGAVHHLED